jgi:uncharacterized delta-60 repeat protein
MNALLLVVSLILAVGSELAWGQSTWARSYGTQSEEDVAETIASASDGGYAVAGATRYFANINSLDAFVIKLDSSGDVEWQKIYGGTGNDRVCCIVAVSDGGFVLAGSTSSFGAGMQDFWVIKLNASGDVEWQKAYGGASIDEANVIATVSDGGFIVAGSTLSFGAGSTDLWVLKLDASGNVEWQKAYGGPSSEQANSITSLADGGFAVCGLTFSFGAGDRDVWVLKLNSSGGVEWQKTYGGAGIDEANSITQISGGGFVVVGSSDSFGVDNSDFWILTINDSGDIQWQKTYGGASTDFAESVHVTSDNGFIVGGSTASFGGTFDFWLLRLNSSGIVQWQKTYNTGDDDLAKSLLISNGRYVVAGYSDSFTGEYDFWVLNLNFSGEINSACTLAADSSASPDDSNGVTTDSNAISNDTAALQTDTSVTGDGSAVLQTAVQCMQTCLFCDDFEDSVMSTNWKYGNGNWSESSGNLSGNDAGKDTVIASPAFEGCLTCSVTAQISTGGGIGNRVSVIGWYFNKGNYVEAILKEESDKLVFRQKINRNVVLKHKASVDLEPGEVYEVQISFNGNQYLVVVDGVSKIIAQPAIISAGTVGFGLKNTTAQFHEIIVN